MVSCAECCNPTAAPVAVQARNRRGQGVTLQMCPGCAERREEKGPSESAPREEWKCNDLRHRPATGKRKPGLDFYDNRDD